MAKPRWGRLETECVVGDTTASEKEVTTLSGENAIPSRDEIVAAWLADDPANYEVPTESRVIRARVWYNKKRKAEQAEAARPSWINPDGSIVGLQDFDSTSGKIDFDNSLKEHIKGMPALQGVLELTVKEPKTYRQGGGHVKFRCPSPDHTDNEPTASINEATKEWCCHGICSAGGKDLLSLYAVAHGYTTIGQKIDSSRMGPMMEELATRYGMPSGRPTRDVAPSDTDGSVDTETVEDIPEDEVTPVPVIDLDKVVPNKSGFIRAFCDAAGHDDSPKEFHFWTALLGPGLAVGRNITDDDEPYVTANLSMCMVANTGTGKTRGMRFITQILEKVMPFDEMDPATGVWIEKNPRSGEFLLDGFIQSPVNVTPTAPVVNGKISPVPVRGIITADELSTFISASKLTASTMKDVILEFSDGSDRIQTGSRGSGRRIARDAFGSILTTTQPDSLRSLLTRHDLTSGFANRFFYPHPNPVKRRSRGRTALDFTEAEEALRKIRDWGSTPRVLEWTVDAIDYWDDVFQSDIKHLMESAPILVRLDLLMKRIALILAIDDMADNVEIGHIKRALELKEYIVTCYELTARAVVSSADKAVFDFIESKVVSHWKKYKKGASVRDLVGYAHGKYDRDELSKAAELMVRRRVINLTRSEGRGRHTDRFTPN